MRIAVTGASGFLGGRVVAAARAAGHAVVAVTRREIGGGEGVEVRTADLGAGPLPPGLLDGADAVIHAAAGTGGDAAHARDTVGATEAVLAAMPRAARLVLVSSFSVYAVAAMPRWSTLDERSPTEPDGARRDAYARAKIAQERLCVAAAQGRGLALWIARPGAIHGPGRRWSARLGWRRGGRVVTVGGDAPVPAIHVESCAAALVAAATVPDGGWPDDLPVLEGGGRVRVVNLVDPDPPTQAEWLAAAGHGRVVTLPRAPILRAAAALDLAGDLVPALGRRLPRGLGEATLAARFAPLRYGTARREDRLGLGPARPFAATMREEEA